MLCVSRHTLGWAAMAPERVVIVPNAVAEEFTPGEGHELGIALGIEGERVLLRAAGWIRVNAITAMIA